MTGDEFRHIRNGFGLSEAGFMYALGYAGNQNTMHLNCRRYEDGSKPIPLYLARYVWLVSEWKMLNNDAGCSDVNEMPNWPDWPGYHDDEVEP
jgi:hypothetical protein